jgi:hypothetical protein
VPVRGSGNLENQSQVGERDGFRLADHRGKAQWVDYGALPGKACSLTGVILAVHVFMPGSKNLLSSVMSLASTMR